MKKICLFLLLVTALTSCVKDVILDAKEDPLLAVYCVLKVDSVQELKLSYTKSATMAEAPRVTEATAVLTDLTEGREAGRFVQVADSLWQLDYSAIPTHRYRLEVTTPGRESVWAEQTMPAEPSVDSEDATFTTPHITPWLKTLDAIHLVPEPYVDSFSIQVSRVEGIIYHISSPANIWVYGENYDSELGRYVTIEGLCTDYPYIDGINLTGKVWKERTISNDWQYSDARSFSQPYLSQAPINRDFLRFPKSEEQTQCFFTIDGDIDEGFSKINGQYRNSGIVYFAALSDDYDRYLLDAYQQYYAEQSDDLSTIYLRENLYNNIHGGVGIFGSATIIPVTWIRVQARILAFKSGFHF